MGKDTLCDRLQLLLNRGVVEESKIWVRGAFAKGVKRVYSETFGVDYACPHTNGEFSDLYKAASASKRSTVIEVKGSRQENLQQHRALQARISALADHYLFR